MAGIAGLPEEHAEWSGVVQKCLCLNAVSNRDLDCLDVVCKVAVSDQRRDLA